MSLPSRAHNRDHTRNCITRRGLHWNARDRPLTCTGAHRTALLAVDYTPRREFKSPSDTTQQRHLRRSRPWRTPPGSRSRPDWSRTGHRAFVDLADPLADHVLRDAICVDTSDPRGLDLSRPNTAHSGQPKRLRIGGAHGLVRCVIKIKPRMSRTARDAATSCWRSASSTRVQEYASPQTFAAGCSAWRAAMARRWGEARRRSGRPPLDGRVRARIFALHAEDPGLGCGGSRRGSRPRPGGVAGDGAEAVAVGAGAGAGGRRCRSRARGRPGQPVALSACRPMTEEDHRRFDEYRGAVYETPGVWWTFP